jgi:hypothetical protein
MKINNERFIILNFQKGRTNSKILTELLFKPMIELYNKI